MPETLARQPKMADRPASAVLAARHDLRLASASTLGALIGQSKRQVTTIRHQAVVDPGITEGDRDPTRRRDRRRRSRLVRPGGALASREVVARRRRRRTPACRASRRCGSRLRARPACAGSLNDVATVSAGLHRPSVARRQRRARAGAALALLRRLPDRRVPHRSGRGRSRCCPRSSSRPPTPAPSPPSSPTGSAAPPAAHELRRSGAGPVQGVLPRRRLHLPRAAGEPLRLHLGRQGLRDVSRLDPGLPEEARLDPHDPDVSRWGRPRRGSSRARGSAPPAPPAAARSRARS